MCFVWALRTCIITNDDKEGAILSKEKTFFYRSGNKCALKVIRDCAESRREVGFKNIKIMFYY